jgi:hypothetical protein
LGAIQSVAPSLGIELTTVPVREASEIDRSVAAFANGANSDLIVTANAFGANHPDLITAQATAVRRAKQVSRSSLSRPFLMQQLTRG